MCKPLKIKGIPLSTVSKIYWYIKLLPKNLKQKQKRYLIPRYFCYHSETLSELNTSSCSDTYSSPLYHVYESYVISSPMACKRDARNEIVSLKYKTFSTALGGVATVLHTFNKLWRCDGDFLVCVPHVRVQH